MESKGIVSIKPSEDLIPYREIPKVIFNRSCKLCNSDNREDAERIYEAKNSIGQIKKVLESKGEKISFTSIQNHMRQHYAPYKNISVLKWYADDLTKWVDNTKDKEGSLKVAIGMLDREIFMLSSVSDDLPLRDRRLNAEQIRKLIDTKLSCEKILAEFQSEIEPVKYVFQQLNIIIQDRLDHANSPEARGVVVGVLDDLQHKLEERSIKVDRD